MNILHIIASVDPKGGGPREGVLQRGLKLVEMGHQVEVASLDDAQAPFVAAYGLPVHALGTGKGGYSYSKQLVPWLKVNANKYDAVIINGIWQYHSYAAWLVLRHKQVPYYVFTHGMLDPWFKRTYPLKHLKKWLYWPWAEYRVLRDATAVLFTCEEEKRLARESFWLYQADERVVCYGTKTPPQEKAHYRSLFLAQYPHLKDKRILLFLSRIHEKKGCDLLLKAFAQAAGQDEGLHLVMAGAGERALVETLTQQAQTLGLAHRVTWVGMVQGEQKWAAYHASEVFILPSHQENFGIAVAEALGCGVPVLISDKVNIWREIEQDGVGFVEPDTVHGATQLINKWLASDDTVREKMGLKALGSFQQRYTVQAMADSLLEVIHHSRVFPTMAEIK